jgi:hypothetical protein
VATGAGQPFWRLTGVLLLAGFTAATLVLLARALRPGPTVVIDDRGLVDRTGLFPTGRLAWAEIAALRKREIGRGFGRERLLEVVVVDPDRFRARPRGWPRRVADRYRRLIKQPEVTIPGSMVASPLSDLVGEARRRRPQLDVWELPPPRPGIFARLGRPKGARPGRQHPDLPRW